MTKTTTETIKVLKDGTITIRNSRNLEMVLVDVYGSTVSRVWANRYIQIRGCAVGFSVNDTQDMLSSYVNMRGGAGTVLSFHTEGERHLEELETVLAWLLNDDLHDSTDAKAALDICRSTLRISSNQ